MGACGVLGTVKDEPVNLLKKPDLVAFGTEEAEA